MSDMVTAVLSIIPKIPIRGVYYIGQYGTSGYASAARGYLFHYFSNGIPITWEPLYFDNSKVGNDDVYDVVIKSLINKPISSYDMVIMHSTPDLWPQFWIEKENVLKNKIVNGYCTWETNRLPKDWIKGINGYVNEVWCPSTYNKQAFEESGVTTPIRVVPHIFLPQILPSRDQVKLIDIATGNRVENDGRFTFYTIGEFISRKSIPETIRVFCEAFTDKDPVRLILKVHYRNYMTDNKKKCIELLKEEIDKYKNHPPIVCLTDGMTSKEILALHSLGDCYLGLTKSEGFGLTIFDAFNYGKRVIATGYSGHVDFLGKDFPGLVQYKLGPVEGMTTFSSNYTDDQLWAIPNIDHAISLVRGIVK